jgi:hypothetical protein
MRGVSPRRTAGLGSGKAAAAVRQLPGRAAAGAAGPRRSRRELANRRRMLYKYWKRESETRANSIVRRAANFPADGDVPAFYISSFNLSVTSNEVVLIGNELHPTWGPAGEPQAPQLRPRLVLRLSPTIGQGSGRSIE